MAKVLVKLHGEEVTRLTLESGMEYIAGRAQDVAIPLSAEKGISRHHLKFYEREGTWVCQTLSKFTLIHRGGNSVEVLELTEACAFSVPPYEFVFEPTPTEMPAAAEDEQAGSSENLPAFYQPKIGAQADSPVSEDTNPRANNEATIAGIPAKLVPYLRISYPSSTDEEILKLEGHLWIAGRDPNCEIPVDSPHISRKHFELARTKEGFFVTDLGSSNGTKINGQKIPPHEPTRLNSGDEMQIKNITMSFEIRDANFDHRIEALGAPAFDPMFSPGLPMAYMPPGAHDETEMRSQRGLTRIRDMGTRKLRRVKEMGTKKLFVRGALFCLTAITVISALIPDKKEQPKPRDPTSVTSVSFDKLTNEQRLVVKDSFNLARNLYVQGKYQLCLTELAKLHEVIPLYENSKELESFCKQGVELVNRQRDLDRKQQLALENEQRISAIVENCKLTLKNSGSLEETRNCLSPAMEFDPEHHLIVEMLHTAQMHEEERKFTAARRKEEDAKAARGNEHYRRAEEIQKSGQLAKALKEYEQYVKTPYPRSEENKNKARRAIASITVELKSKIGALLDQCKSLADKGQWKDAYYACDKAVDEDPANDTAKSKRSQMLAELKRELKGIYEDSTLEESLGNVDSAKEKWKKLEKDDLKDGEYAKKARAKLQKYGAGI